MLIGEYLNTLNSKESLNKLYWAGLIQSNIILALDVWNFHRILMEQGNNVTTTVKLCSDKFRVSERTVFRYLQQMNTEI